MRTITNRIIGHAELAASQVPSEEIQQRRLAVVEILASGCGTKFFIYMEHFCQSPSAAVGDVQILERLFMGLALIFKSTWLVEDTAVHGVTAIRSALGLSLSIDAVTACVESVLNLDAADLVRDQL